MDIQNLVANYVSVLIKVFFLMTPFFALSMFLAMTPDMTAGERRKLANRVAFAALKSCKSC